MSIRNRIGARLPFDVIVCALLIAVSGIAFFVVGLVRDLTEHDPTLLHIPIIALVLEAVAAVIVLTGFRFGRSFALVVVLVAALAHLVIALGGGFVWVRVASGVLAAVNIYALVVFNMKPVRVHFGLDTND